MNEKKIQIGGQAVIEGVMMRGPEHIATAVRRKDGSVDVQVQPFISVTTTHPLWKRPIIRGFVSLIEMLKIGLKALTFSADRYSLDAEKSSTDPTQTPSDEKTDPTATPDTLPSDTTSTAKITTKSTSAKLQEYICIAIGLALAFFLFGYLPYLLSSLLGLDKQDDTKTIVLFNLFAGSIRIVFFVLYVFLISLMKDIRRVFEYHGAEHKSVFAHEQKVPLTVENVRPYTTIHPRCGTSFMFFVLLVAILVFSIIDTLVAMKWNIPVILSGLLYADTTPKEPVIKLLSTLIRLLYHLPFLPIISGISYEFLKLSAKKENNPIVKIFTAPGMALQKITTQPPDDEQIEVAIIALKAAIKDDLSDHNVNLID